MVVSISDINPVDGLQSYLTYKIKKHEPLQL